MQNVLNGCATGEKLDRRKGMRYMISVIQKMIDRSVKKYLDALPTEKMVNMARHVIGTEELSKEVLQSLIDQAKGDRVVQIYFKGGDMVQVSNRASSQPGGPGW